MIKLQSINNCTGCAACVSACPQKSISMNMNKEGFLFPVIEKSSCIKCKRCIKVCPINNNDDYDSPLSIYAIKNTRIERNGSSSGAVFPLLAREFIKKNGVVFGAKYSNNFDVEHTDIDSELLIRDLCGTKYSQSYFLNVYEKIIRVGRDREILVTGTPCQIAGVKSFLGSKCDNVTFVDCICMGVPSPLIWSKYVQYRSKIDNNGELPHEINLRSKVSGWSNYNYSIEFKYDKNSYCVKNNEDIYMRLFTSASINRNSCENCHFKGNHRSSDITLGDFWGVWNCYPFFDDDLGVSIVFVWTSEGQKLIDEIKKQDIEIIKVDYQDAVNTNPMFYQSKNKNRKRNQIIKKALTGDFQSAVNLI